MTGNPTIVPRAQPEKNEDVESIALAGATAIQQLIKDRNGLRSRVGALERQTSELRSTNEELRRCLVLMREHYVEMATKFVSHLEEVDTSIHAMMQATAKARGDTQESSLVSLAQRLSPFNMPEKGAPRASQVQP